GPTHDASAISLQCASNPYIRKAWARSSNCSVLFVRIGLRCELVVNVEPVRRHALVLVTRVPAV
ncbi:hypothetical protein, partial [Caballeronia terrestris]|uniref:hypothetical protein n=1 Tax=Caballeronia terrestris TaxID=1226301 RepID=UPI001F2A7E62